MPIRYHLNQSGRSSEVVFSSLEAAMRTMYLWYVEKALEADYVQRNMPVKSFETFVFVVTGSTVPKFDTFKWGGDKTVIMPRATSPSKELIMRGKPAVHAHKIRLREFEWSRGELNDMGWLP